MKAIMISFDQAHYENIINVLDRSNARGYTMVETTQYQLKIPTEPTINHKHTTNTHNINHIMLYKNTVKTAAKSDAITNTDSKQKRKKTTYSNFFGCQYPETCPCKARRPSSLSTSGKTSRKTASRSGVPGKGDK